MLTGGIMSDIIEAPTKKSKSRIILLIALVLSILLLFLVYGAGAIGLPVLILRAYP